MSAYNEAAAYIAANPDHAVIPVALSLLAVAEAINELTTAIKEGRA